MNIFFIERYIQKIKKDDIYNFAYTEGINLTLEELDTLYTYLKTYYKPFLRQPDTRINLLEELKSKVSLKVSNKLDELYNTYKDKI